MTTDGTHPADSGRIKVANMLLQFFSTDSTTTPWFLRTSQQTLRGDLDQNGVIDIVDITSLINFVVFGTPVPPNPASTDVNCDAVADVVDIVGLIQFVVFGSPAPCPL